MTITEASVRGDTLVYWLVNEDTNEWRDEGLIKLSAIQHVRLERCQSGHGLAARGRLRLVLHLQGADALDLWFDEPTDDTEHCSNPYLVANDLWSILTKDARSVSRPKETT